MAAAAKVADNKPQLASDKLQRCYESPQLGLPATQFPCYAAAELKIQIAQGFGLQPYNKHSVIEICAEAQISITECLLYGTPRRSQSVRFFLVCNGCSSWKRAFSSALLTGFTNDAMPGGLLCLPLCFRKAGIWQASGNESTIYMSMFTSSASH